MVTLNLSCVIYMSCVALQHLENQELKMFFEVDHKSNVSLSQILRRRARMVRLLFILSMSALCLTLPIKEDTLDIFNSPELTTNTSETETFPTSDVFISSLLPPSSISDCLTSGYCNQGDCFQGIVSAVSLNCFSKKEK